MSEHTKTPWRAETKCWTPWNGAIGILPIDQDEDSAVAWTTSGSNEEANAAFIVKAVNSHDTLVKALTDARAAIASLPMETLGYASDPTGAEIHWPIRDELLHRIDTALSADAPVNGDVATSVKP